MLGAAAHLSLNVFLTQEKFDPIHAVLHEFQAFFAGFIEFPGDFVIDLGLRKPQRQVFEFPLHLPDTQTVGQGGIKRQRFATVVCRARRPGRCKPAQRLQAARQTKHHHPQIMAHREQHPSQSFGLIRRIRFPAAAAGPLTHGRKPLQIRHELQDDFAERFLNPVFRIVHAVRYAEEVRGADQFFIFAHAAENFRHAVGMGKPVFPRVKLLIQIKRLHQPAGKLPIGPAFDNGRFFFGLIRVGHSFFLSLRAPASVNRRDPLSC